MNKYTVEVYRDGATSSVLTTSNPVEAIEEAKAQHEYAMSCGVLNASVGIRVDKEEAKMKRYDLMRACAESRHEIEALYAFDLDPDPELIKSFDSKEEALQALKRYQGSQEKFQSHSLSFYRTTTYAVIEQEYDENGEWVSGWDLIDYV